MSTVFSEFPTLDKVVEKLKEIQLGDVWVFELSKPGVLLELGVRVGWSGLINMNHVNKHPNEALVVSVDDLRGYEIKVSCI